MKHFAAFINQCAKYFLCMLTCMVLLMHSAIAQKKHKLNKPATSTSRKVFYGEASFYANKFNGRHTASGEIFSQRKLTCACNVLPFGTYVKVTNVKNGKWAIVKVNDRLHPKMRRIVDLTSTAAIQLGYKDKGFARVKVEVVNAPQK